MNKVRVIPTILSDGYSQVKGEKFNNWRTVGSVIAAVKLFASRDVDEIALLDTRATLESRTPDLKMIESLSSFLRVPLSVGGGVNTIRDIKNLLSAGADKVILGTACITHPELVNEAAQKFGSQALVCSIDLEKDFAENSKYMAFSGTKLGGKDALEFAKNLEIRGAGEILLQNVSRDGTRLGFDLEAISRISKEIGLPLIASSGAGSGFDAVQAVAAGASAVAMGALFQFTQETPKTVREQIKSAGYPVRSTS